MNGEIKIKQQARGTRIIAGSEARARRELLNQLIALADRAGFDEIILPSLEKAEIYTDKAGAEVLGQMYAFPDKKGRELCLRPEATATIQLIADEHLKNQKDVKFWYFEKCFRYERPQTGRYREFWQFGCEWINPRNPAKAKTELIALASEMVELQTENFEVHAAVKRGLDYYTEDGFEITVDALGAQKQTVGGGSYRQGIGFAVGFERLMLCK